ncbi:MAG: SDR family oxidoreductase [Candidatus Nanohaloarchaea archaeon]
MRVLVAGNGFIGQALVERLDDEHEITTLDADDADITQDITQSFEVEEEFDVVYHTIGLAPGLYSEETYRNVHVEGTRNLLDAVETEKVVYVSALRAGESDYSFFTTKKEAEELVKDSGLDYTIVRPSTVYGEGNKLIDTLRRAAKTHVFPDIEAEIQPIQLDDLVEVLVECGERFSGEELEIAGPEKMKVTEFVREIYRQEGKPCHLFSFPEKPMSIGLKVLDRLPRPLSYGHYELLSHHNVTDDNDATDIVDLEPVF